jgi:hypothetical protein
MLTSAAPVAAGVIRIAIDQKQSPAYDGKSFGGVGQYEILTGRAFGELDPKDPHNTIITDLEFAPRNPRGKVQYVATFIVVKPIDLAKSNGVLFYGVHAPDHGRQELEEPGKSETAEFDSIPIKQLPRQIQEGFSSMNSIGTAHAAGFTVPRHRAREHHR